jgi:hypothetical protein
MVPLGIPNRMVMNEKILDRQDAVCCKVFINDRFPHYNRIMRMKIDFLGWKL